MTARALIVDDSLTVRMDLAAALESAGFEAVLAATGEAARRALREAAFDLVILDVLLPDDDGVEILRSIRENPESAGMPVMLLSTEAEVRDRIRGLATGADDYVGKPYDGTYVVARARELVRRAGPSPASGSVQSTVLIIDDSPTFRELLRERVEAAGHRVLTAASGEDGLRLAANERPQAILVDGNLPGIDGAGVIRRIRLDSALRRTPCILVTADEAKDAEVLALEAGADAFLKKEDGAEMAVVRLSAVLRGAAASRNEQEPSTLGPKKILAVDDSPTYLNELARTLGEDGYQVVLARSGEEALELLAIEDVDCILLDLMMPGLGGHETCRRIKAAAGVRETPLIMLTALENREDMIEGLRSGADDYISKATDLQVLRARVVAQIRRKQFEDENRHIREELLRKEIEAAEARAARELAETRAALLADVERKNKELEAFSYSISHDLRAPLRTIDGFSQMLLEDFGAKLGDAGCQHVERLRKAAKRMAELIDDLLDLSRIGRESMTRSRLDLSELVREVHEEARRKEGERLVELVVPATLLVDGDRRLLRVLVENLVGNALKFTGKTEHARVELGREASPEGMVYFIRDNGAGFDMRYAEKLFAPFQRLHRDAEFPGTGIGLATVYRVVDRHGGRVWAEGKIGVGATVYFTLGERREGAASVVADAVGPTARRG